MSNLLQNVCRLCGIISEESVKPLQQQEFSHYTDKINCYLNLQVLNEDKSWQLFGICHDCCERIDQWDKFVQKVSSVNAFFTSLPNSMPEIYSDEEEKNVEESTRLKKRKRLKANLDEIKREVDIKEFVTPIRNFAIGDCSEESKEWDESNRLKNRLKIKKTFVNSEEYIGSVVKEDVTHKNYLFCDDVEEILNDGETYAIADCAIKEKYAKRLPVCEDDKEERFNRRNEFIQEELNEEKYGTHLKKDLPDDQLSEGECRTLADEDCLEERSSEPEDTQESETNQPGVQEKEKTYDADLSNLTWECFECKETYATWNALVRHSRLVHNCAAKLQCLCGQFLQSRSSVIKHYLKHTVGLKYKCDFKNCTKTFFRQSLLDKHLLSHLPKDKQPWLCCKCSRRFHSEYLLKQHERLHLPKDEKVMYPCEVCKRKLCSKSAVTAHIRAVHLRQRPFVCDQCGLCFASKGILAEHLMTHSDVFNHHCQNCGKSFKTIYRLRIHMDTHLQTKYSCPVCRLTLNTRRTLRMHLLVHKEKKEFSCDTCHKAFRRSKDLKNHRNLHTGQRPYSCPFCPRTFANGSNCRSHKRRMHPVELKEYENAMSGKHVGLPSQNQIIADTNDEEQAILQEDVLLVEPTEETAEDDGDVGKDDGDAMSEMAADDLSANFTLQSVHAFQTAPFSCITPLPGNHFLYR